MRIKVLNFLVRCAIVRRKVVLAVTLIVTLAAIAGASRLTIDPRWSALLPEKLEVVKEFNRIDESYIQPANMIVAVSGEDPLVIEEIIDTVEALVLAEMVAPSGWSKEDILLHKKYVRHVYGRNPVEWMEEYGLALLKPDDARRMSNIFANPNFADYLSALNDDFEAEYSDSDSVRNNERQVVSSLQALEYLIDLAGRSVDGTISDREIDRVVRDILIGSPYTLSLDGTMGLVMVAPALGTDNVDALVEMDRMLEYLLMPLGAEYPGYTIERTGIVAVSRDEMDSVGPYTMAISMVVLVLIFLMLTYNFRSFVIPLISLIPVVIGIIWVMGFVGITLGSLNLITVMIMVVLLGLGIDFTIHLSSRFMGEFSLSGDLEKALIVTLTGTGKGVITGALTTAVAFFVLISAETKAVKEFGFCAGAGVIFTLIATLWVLPALLAFWVGRHRKKDRPVKPIRLMPGLGRSALWFGRHRVFVALLFVVITAAGVIGGLKLEWEWNFMNLEAKGLRSVELQDEIVEKYKLSQTTSMLRVESVEESRRLRKEFKDLSVVGEVNDISQWVSRDDVSETLGYVAKLRDAESSVVLHTTISQQELSRIGEELDRLWANLVEIQALSITGGQERVVEKTKDIVASRENRNEGKLRVLADRVMSMEHSTTGLAGFVTAFSVRLKAAVEKTVQVDQAVTLEMVPTKYLDQFVSSTEGSYLMTIMPVKNLFNREDLVHFKNVVTEIDSGVTGLPQLIIEMNDSTLKDGKRAMGFAFLVIVLLLVYDFKNPLIALLTTLPLLISLALTLGTMWLFGQKLNYINMIALPVIIGIGVDDGVHFFHQLKERGKGTIKETAASAGRAMLLTSLTTMAGFGSLMFYLMRGMASLGFVLFFGVAYCFIVTIVLLPGLALFCEKNIFK